MIDVVVIISIHSVYNCKYVQSSGHPISCATNPPPSRRQPENFSQRLPPYEQCVIFVSLSLSPSQLSRLFFVFFPSFVDTHTSTDGQTDTVIRYIRYSSQCKSPSSRLNMRFTFNSFYLLCSRLLSSVLCVFSFFLSISVSRLQ